MGGIGSGRQFYWGARTKTTDYRSIDIRRWHRDGLLEPGLAYGWEWKRNGEVVASIRVRTETGRVILSYKHRSSGEEWQDESYPVSLAWTECNYGGKRPWFLCPAQGCGQRVAILYGGGIFACRHCYDLAYPCQRENKCDRLTRRADKIRDRMGWGPGILNGVEWKPKGMHWRTYERLCAEHEALVDRAIGMVAIKFNLVGDSRHDWF